MNKNHWLIILVAVLIIGLIGLALLAGTLMLGFFAGRETAVSGGSGLPIYKTEQSASSHAGHRHTTLICGNEVFVNDYEEACLQLANPDPTQSIGDIGWAGNVHVCAIPGQPAIAWIAGDCGSEMPAFEPFRNVKQPPFDWRTATFQKVDFLPPGGRSNWRQSTNAALLAEVVRVLRDGPPVELNPFPFSGATNLTTLNLTSDQLPGLLFCPALCYDGDGNIYIAESLMTDFTSSPPQVRAGWIPASPLLAQWVKAP